MHRWQVVIPDLYWPDPRDTAPYEGLTLPALSRLLSRGKVRAGAPIALETWIEQLFGHRQPSSIDFPWAAVERAGLGLNSNQQGWCRADPVHLKTRRNSFYLAHGQSLALTPEEASALAETLNTHFAQDQIEFSVIAPERWHVCFDTASVIQTTPVAQAEGRNIDALLPRGQDAPLWTQRLNEAQMLLHEHPVNIARESRGALTINSIWPWGFGSMPTLSKPDVDLLLTTSPLYRGLGAITGIENSPTIAGFEPAMAESKYQNALVILETPRDALARASGEAWREALLAIDNDWLMPMTKHLQAGHYRELEVILLSQDNSVSVGATRADLFQFWHKTRAWTQWRPSPET